ncbi:hypothetical protein [Orientia tsutsugamushi]|uniref:hypothetical protein n=1 Tax=Orientia tsutsugamushi TaxID=784 RepID=UPI0013A581FC|nr:hypothetical protein [Orientia tsutsugamushi]
MPLFIYYFLYSFHISILCTYFLRSCYKYKTFQNIARMSKTSTEWLLNVSCI